jgi:molybdenum cofactor cytidylyltransferase
MIGAVVLAAGASYRMGSPKALLRIGGNTFVQHIVDVLHSAGVHDVVIVLGAEAELIQQTLYWFDGKVIVNENWKQGQLTSIIAGLSVLNQTFPGLLICPVDHPLITKSLIIDLVGAFQKSGKKIVVPVNEGRRGHPVIFSSDLFGELRNASLEVGARQLIRSHPDDVHELVTNEVGVVLNIDTPDEYQKVMLRVAHCNCPLSLKPDLEAFVDE